MEKKKLKIKIILAGSYPPPYHGTSIYLKNLYSLLKLDPKKEFEVFIIDTSDKRNDITNLGKLDILNVISAFKSFFVLIVKLIIHKIDVVYIPISQNKLAYFRDGIFIIISKIFGKKVIIHLHGSYFLEFYNNCPQIYKKFIDITLKMCAGVIVLGKKLKYLFLKWFNTNKIFILPNFVESFNILQKQNNFSDNRKHIKISYLGNIVESKGIFDLLDAFIEVIKKNNNIILQLIGQIGDDPITGLSKIDTEKKLLEKISNYKGNIRCFGQIIDKNQKYNLLNQSDIFVYPSRYEGQPLVILEAMSCRLPIISTKNCGVIDETVIDGYNGILVEKKNIGQLSEAMEKLIFNEHLRKKMGENSRKLYEKYYTPEIHLEKFKDIIHNAIT